MVQAEGKRSCRATVQDERTESSWEPWGADKVSRRDDGTLTLRDLSVKAVAVCFWSDSTE
jgi:cupin 2 domain-containing protein